MHSGASEAVMQPQKVVLVVDDLHDQRDIIAIYLEYMGYRVLTAGDGAQALRVVGLDSPDLILMDITMPHLDGYAATRSLKANPLTASIPVLALSANVLGREVADATAAGCDGYLMKPIGPRDVYDEIVRRIGLPVR
jgi:two-component system, cell cycle response regulator DivK